MWSVAEDVVDEEEEAAEEEEQWQTEGRQPPSCSSRRHSPLRLMTVECRRCFVTRVQLCEAHGTPHVLKPL